MSSKCSEYASKREISIHQYTKVAGGLSSIDLFMKMTNTLLGTLLIIMYQVVGRAGETSIYSWSRFCTINCRPTASNYQPSYMRTGWDLNSDFTGGRQVCHHCATMAPLSAEKRKLPRILIRKNLLRFPH